MLKLINAVARQKPHRRLPKALTPFRRKTARNETGCAYGLTGQRHIRVAALL